ncbi:hypothetical protein IJZ97_04265 [bacterium]|nr:hypothetical protein [bacterium]
MFKNLAKSSEKAVYRFNHGWNKIGAVSRPKDTRSQSEIITTINTMLESSPELENFASGLHQMDPKYLGLAADTIELSRIREFLPTGINMNKVSKETGKSLIQTLLEVLPKASKENPGAMEFTQEVMNNTDTITSKYFLANLLNVIERPELSNHFIAAKPLVKDIAEQTLKGGYTMDYSKQKNFMDFVQTLVNPTVKIDKLELLPKLSKVAKDLEADLYVDRFVQSNTPAEIVADNIEVLPQVAEIFATKGKSFDIVDFAAKNVNLK